MCGSGARAKSIGCTSPATCPMLLPSSRRPTLWKRHPWCRLWVVAWHRPSRGVRRNNPTLWTGAIRSTMLPVITGRCTLSNNTSQLMGRLDTREKWLLQLPNDAPAGDLSRIEIDTKKKEVTAGCGTTVSQVIAALAEQGYSLPFGPMFSAMSTCGAIATGAHGSVLKEAATLADLLTSFDVVDGTGSLHTYKKKQARKYGVNFGALGVMTAVTLRVEPRQAATAHTYTLSYTNDTMTTVLNDMLQQIKRDCSNGQFNWFPGQHKFVLFCINKIGEANAAAASLGKTLDDLTGTNYFFAPQSVADRSAEMQRFDAIVAAQFDSAAFSARTCGLTSYTVNALASPHVFGAGTFPALGYFDRLGMSSLCDDLNACAYQYSVQQDGSVQPSRRYTNLDVSVPLKRLSDIFVAFEQQRLALFDGACLSSYGVSLHVRLMNAPGVALLGPSKGKKAVLEIVTHIPSHMLASREQAMQDTLRHIVLNMVGDKAYFHGGKNSAASFRMAAQSGKSQFSQSKKFESERKRRDPSDLFNIEFVRNFVALEHDDTLDLSYDGCGITGHCVCSMPSHCGVFGVCLSNGACDAAIMA
ncbi:MAG: hypothetical protein MHM6MM_004688 [Cercozoa sp. M6MM]